METLLWRLGCSGVRGRVAARGAGRPHPHFPSPRPANELGLLQRGPQAGGTPAPGPSIAAFDLGV